MASVQEATAQRVYNTLGGDIGSEERLREQYREQAQYAQYANATQAQMQAQTQYAYTQYGAGFFVDGATLANNLLFAYTDTGTKVKEPVKTKTFNDILKERVSG